MGPRSGRAPSRRLPVRPGTRSARRRGGPSPVSVGGSPSRCPHADAEASARRRVVTGALHDDVSRLHRAGDGRFRLQGDGAAADPDDAPRAVDAASRERRTGDDAGASHEPAILPPGAPPADRRRPTPADVARRGGRRRGGRRGPGAGPRPRRRCPPTCRRRRARCLARRPAPRLGDRRRRARRRPGRPDRPRARLRFRRRCRPASHGRDAVHARLALEVDHRDRGPAARRPRPRRPRSTGGELPARVPAGRSRRGVDGHGARAPDPHQRDPGSRRDRAARPAGDEPGGPGGRPRGRRADGEPRGAVRVLERELPRPRPSRRGRLRRVVRRLPRAARLRPARHARGHDRPCDRRGERSEPGPPAVVRPGGQPPGPRPGRLRPGRVHLRQRGRPGPIPRRSARGRSLRRPVGRVERGRVGHAGWRGRDRARRPAGRDGLDGVVPRRRADRGPLGEHDGHGLDPGPGPGSTPRDRPPHEHPEHALRAPPQARCDRSRRRVARARR